MLSRTFIALVSVFVAGAVLAQAYKWTDEDGVVHFSDRPREGAEQIELAAPVRPPPPPPRTVSRAAAATAAPAPEDAGPFEYESLSISSPIAEETLWNIEGVLNVTLNLQPALQQGHRIRVFFDGTPRFVTQMSFEIDEVYRGMHNIQAEIVDKSGKMMIRSTPNRFYVQQTTIAGPR